MSSANQQSLLDLLEGDREVDTLQMIDPKKVHVSHLIEPSTEFVESIRKHGVKESVYLRRAGTLGDDDEGYYVISGRRRVRAAIIVGLESIPAYISNRTSDAYDAAMTVELQAQRSDNPIADFESIKLLIKKAYSKEEIKNALGIDSDKIDKLLSLDILSSDILEAVSDRKVGITTAFSLAKLSEEYRVPLEEKFREEGKLTGKDVKNIKQVRSEEAGSVLSGDIFGNEDDYVSPIEKIKALHLISGEDMDGDGDEYQQGWNAAIEAVLQINF